jgi:hypothetical protein
LAPALDGGDDFVGISLPDEEFRVIVGFLEEAVDGGLEVDDRAEACPGLDPGWVPVRTAIKFTQIAWTYLRQKTRQKRVWSFGSDSIRPKL